MKTAKVTYLLRKYKLNQETGEAPIYCRISFTSEEKSKFTLHVTDLLGNVLVSEVVNAEAGVNQQELNFMSFAKGVYLIKLRSDKGIFSTRLIVE